MAYAFIYCSFLAFSKWSAFPMKIYDASKISIHATEHFSFGKWFIRCDCVFFPALSIWGACSVVLCLSIFNSINFIGIVFAVRYAWARDYAYLIELTCIGSQRSAKAATTTNTSRVTRFRPRCDSFVRLCGTTVRHNLSINAYSPLISVNGIKYELEKNIMWKAANEIPPLLNTQNL